MKVKIFLFMIFILTQYACGLDSLPLNQKIVINRGVIVHTKPDVASGHLYELNIAQVIELIQNSNIINSKGDVEGWSYVDSLILSNNRSIKGWIIKSNIADQNEFRRTKLSREYFIEGWVGDYVFSYHFYKNGVYHSKIYNYKKKKYDVKKGHVYRFNNVITPDGLDYFYIYDDNISSYWLNVDNNKPFVAETNKSKFKY